MTASAWLSEARLTMSGNARFVLLLGLLAVLAGCNSQGQVTVTGPTGEMTVLVREDYADIGTSQRLTRKAIQDFVDENGRFPIEEELGGLPVSWSGRDYVLQEIVDFSSVRVAQNPANGVKQSPISINAN